MKPVSENELKSLIGHFQRFSHSLQHVLHQRTGKYFHDNAGEPIQHVYLCPICLKNKAAFVTVDDFRADDEFTLDHFPPKSVNGKGKVLVCKKCNSTAGTEYDYAVKEWIQEQAFVHHKAGSKMPVTMHVENFGGKYRESLVSNGSPLNFTFDRFERYPKMKEFFEKILGGESMVLKLGVKSTPIETVYRAMVKTAYLKAFSMWGYDFVYTDTGVKMRDVFLNNGPHPLSNCGVFFHMEEPFPPEGLSYIFDPVELQSFALNFMITDKENDFSCYVTVLIPGDYKSDWFNLKHFQPIIDRQGTFTSKLIKLPEDILSNQNLYPYTETWHNRSSFRIAGVHDNSNEN